jgi:hypothetical protein
MKKIISFIILLTFLTLFSSLIILSTIGIETDKFNNFISKKINQTNNNFIVDLNSVKFKFDIKEISLFLETNNPIINYRNEDIPTKNIKVYMDFISLIKTDPQIKKINIFFNQLNIEELKKISVTFKPSNLTSFINNKIKEGIIAAELEIYLQDNNKLDNFIARGTISNLKAKIIKNLELKKTNLSFFADKSDVILKNITGEAGPFKIEDGDLKVKLSSEISLESNFKTNLKYEKEFKNFENLIKDLNFSQNIVSLEAELKNSFFINFDQTYKVKKYDYKSYGKIIKASFNFKKPIENSFLDEKIKKLTLINSEINTKLSSTKKTTNIFGKYSINNDKFLSFDLKNTIERELFNLMLKADYQKPIKLDIINYQKDKEVVANIFINLNKQKDSLSIKEFDFTEGKNSILVEDLLFKKNKFLSLKKISVKTNKDGKKNNDFSVLYKKNISIKGAQFDASNLPKILNQKTSISRFSKIDKEIEIDFTNIIAPLSENLNNFKLIGKIEKGKFTKISSKGDFGGNNFLDITMKKNQKDNKKYLEIYSDLTRPLLTEYSFFKGLTGGKLLYSSIIEENNSSSKLKIENFKLINAPGVIKLLSLADLGGLADLAQGDGLSFDILEINMEKNNDLLRFNEILALGPSISVLMEGYQDPTVTSLKGTLVPAKNLNKMISKIPILGSIIIPKEAGEGLFGISFKLKGPPGAIKTSINPIKTITPRFIQKIIEKNKNKSPKQF